jgi:hypothetical protein
MAQFIDGAIMITFCVAALCLLRFWRQSRDRFFLFFSLAFWIMAVNRVLLAVLTPERSVPNENHVLLYLVRLLAFAILLAAIIDKNRAPRARPDPGGPPAANAPRPKAQ